MALWLRVWRCHCYGTGSIPGREPPRAVGTVSLRVWPRDGPCSYPDVLEEPGPHDVGGVLGQNPPLVFGGAVVLMQDAQVLV